MAQETTTFGAAFAFSPGRVISASFGVLGRNLVPFVIVTFIISLPYLAIQTWLDYALAHAEPGSSLSGANFAIILVQSITFGLVQAALTYGTVQDLRGEHAGIGDCFRGGLARSGNIVSGAMQYGLLLGLATLLLIIPGIILYLRWWVFIPAMVIEKLETKASFERSKSLTAGRRWAILGLSAVIFVVEMAVLFGVIWIAPGLAADIAVTLLGVLFTTFTSVVAAVGYYHLRAEKEGVIVEDIAKVFD